MREGDLCEQGEGSSLGYETADSWCWQEMLTFAIKLDFFEGSELKQCYVKLLLELSFGLMMHFTD